MNESNRVVDIEWDLLLALVTLDSGKPAKHHVIKHAAENVYILYTLLYSKSIRIAIDSMWSQTAESLD